MRTHLLRGGPGARVTDRTVARPPGVVRAPGRRLAAVITVAAAGTVLAASCGVPTDDSPRALADDDLPPRSTTSEPAESIAPGFQVELYYLQGRELTVVLSGATQLESALQALSGVSGLQEGLQEGIETALFVDVVEVDVEDATATIDLSDDFSVANVGEVARAAAQLVFTATAFESVEQVAFTSGGRAIAVSDDAAGIQDGPVDVCDYDDLLPDLDVTRDLLASAQQKDREEADASGTIPDVPGDETQRLTALVQRIEQVGAKCSAAESGGDGD